MIHEINTINLWKKALLISTFDLSTLRSTINYKTGGLGNYTAAKKFDARWVDGKKNYDGKKFVFKKAYLKLAINYMLDNCYFTFGNLPFR